MGLGEDVSGIFFLIKTSGFSGCKDWRSLFWQLDVAPILQLDLWFLQFLRTKKTAAAFLCIESSHLIAAEVILKKGTNSSQSIVSFWMKVPQPSNDMSSGWIFHREIVPKYTCEVLKKVSAQNWDFVQKEIPCLQKSSFFLGFHVSGVTWCWGFKPFSCVSILYPAKIIQLDRTGRTPHVRFKWFLSDETLRKPSDTNRKESSSQKKPHEFGRIWIHPHQRMVPIENLSGKGSENIGTLRMGGAFVTI